ncbi:hypothetical protein CCACVL1_14784 [Corchorus capsularis]|uniref:Uncharacterized protein n=1 Tax=Corchorus capsularis TaxID=210143 RepID=A0A1R3I5H8_COCAP|nr:hypothetical protein CCACVL1_14784 [Corchorus capsularis]
MEYLAMKKKNNNKVVDVSSFFLFEAIGDSEAGCNFDPAIAVSDEDGDDDDDDDAESCSCDTSDYYNLRAPVRNQVNGLEEIRADVDDQEEYEEDGEVVDQKMEVHHLFEKCRNNQRVNGVVAKNQQKSVVSVDSSKPMNEMEKSRLFWESCLAS